MCIYYIIVSPLTTHNSPPQLVVFSLLCAEHLRIITYEWICWPVKGVIYWGFLFKENVFVFVTYILTARLDIYVM